MPAGMGHFLSTLFNSPALQNRTVASSCLLGRVCGLSSQVFPGVLWKNASTGQRPPQWYKSTGDGRACQGFPPLLSLQVWLQPEQTAQCLTLSLAGKMNLVNKPQIPHRLGWFPWICNFLSFFFFPCKPYSSLMNTVGHVSLDSCKPQA